jgi:hypothetical protein
VAFLPDIRKQSRARTAVERMSRNVSRGIIVAQGCPVGQASWSGPCGRCGYSQCTNKPRERAQLL